MNSFVYLKYIKSKFILSIRLVKYQRNLRFSFLFNNPNHDIFFVFIFQVTNYLKEFWVPRVFSLMINFPRCTTTVFYSLICCIKFITDNNKCFITYISTFYRFYYLMFKSVQPLCLHITLCPNRTDPAFVFSSHSREKGKYLSLSMNRQTYQEPDS